MEFITNDSKLPNSCLNLFLKDEFVKKTEMAQLNLL